MRAVNLLPSTERPVQAAAQANGSYVVLGILGALLIGVVGFVMTQNQVSSRTSEIARVKQERAEAEQKAARLGAFGDFAAVKATRLASVTDLAQARFDWERLMRELALVLPDDTFITEATTSAVGADGESAPTPAAPTTGGLTTGGPTLNLVGCAPTQTAVAEVMVRLSSLHRAEDVQLSESGKPAETLAPTGGGVVASEPTVAAEGCGQDYQFSTAVAFSALPATGAGTRPEGGVPAALGGGS